MWVHLQKMEGDLHKHSRKCSDYKAWYRARGWGREKLEISLFKGHCLFVLPAAQQGKDGNMATEKEVCNLKRETASVSKENRNFGAGEPWVCTSLPFTNRLSWAVTYFF